MFSEHLHHNDKRFFTLGGIPIVTEMEYLERVVVILIAEMGATLSSSSDPNNRDANDATTVLRRSHLSAAQYFALHRMLLEGTEAYFTERKLVIFGNPTLEWETFQRQYSLDKGRIMHCVQGCGNSASSKQVLPVEFWYNAVMNLSKQQEYTDVSFHEMVQLMDQKYVIDKVFLREALMWNDSKTAVGNVNPMIVCNLLAVALIILAVGVAICSTNQDYLG